MASILSGNILVHDGDDSAHNLIPNALQPQPFNPDEDVPLLAERLTRLMTSQSAFGATVGAPVVFYLGAFIYTILDLRAKPSDQDAAISLAFGVEWMIIVHVAIVNGYLLASNNPSPITMLAWRPPPRRDKRRVKPWRRLFPPVYDGIFQPVSMWRRGINKQEWLDRFNDENRTFHADIHADLQIPLWQWFLLIVLPSIILISLPPGAGAFVAFQTPPVGFGCRSLSFLLYFAVQIILTPIYFGTICWKRSRRPGGLGRGIIWVISWGPFAILFAIAIFLSIAGTVMQIMGVYRNCFCYVNTQYWLDLDDAKVNVASDTQAQRDSSRNWIVMGVVASAFMAICTFLGWYLQKMARVMFKKVADNLARG